ncbi:tryptophan synthase beta subunit-like PLP-dependent enzyme [Schizopora paradoxa]|uniref:L-serine ammonia-lyase n=1 Tax=Schizopora paradoxa TaxID=27342 RepID=A0A0H2RFJ4_9AGAM|nr:tryptophan synthase beta subunit-like PLP-dependent enzyme [Schizopora paradoxa]
MSTTPAWIETPTIFSTHLSTLLGCDVYLKLENLQISQSFKYRGLSLFAQHVKDNHGPTAKLIVASGGNAGLATACAARNLGLQCTVYIPDGISDAMMRRLKQEHAEVIVGGENYLYSLRRAEEAVKQDPSAVLVPAYDDPLLWEGHGSMIEEIHKQIPQLKPDVIFCSVGGGGLFGGVMTGCRKVGWDDIPLVILETHGSACFYHSMAMNNREAWTYETPKGISEGEDEKHGVAIAHLSKIESLASSLGASSPSAGVVKMALEREGRSVCVTVPDELSMQSTRLFAEDHKFLVELACATTLTVAYNPELFSEIWGRIQKNDVKPKSIVLIVCGGVKISLDEMESYKVKVRSKCEAAPNWSICCNGENLSIPAQYLHELM